MLTVVDDVADTLDGAVEADEITPDQVVPVILTVLSGAIASVDDAAGRQALIDMVTGSLAEAVETNRQRRPHDDSTSKTSRH
jgi:hypothetical protein